MWLGHSSIDRYVSRATPSLLTLIHLSHDLPCDIFSVTSLIAMDREEYEAALTFMVKELPQSGYLRATRMLITVLHNLYKYPDKEKYRKLKTKNEVCCDVNSGLSGRQAAIVGFEFGSHHKLQVIRAIILLAGVDRCLQALTFQPKASC
jgi:hypothetical protein